MLVYQTIVIGSPLTLGDNVRTDPEVRSTKETKMLQWRVLRHPPASSQADRWQSRIGIRHHGIILQIIANDLKIIVDGITHPGSNNPEDASHD